MIRKDKNVLKRKVESIHITVGRLLQKEAAKSWHGHNTNKLRKINSYIDMVYTWVDELKEEADE